MKTKEELAEGLADKILLIAKEEDFQFTCSDKEMKKKLLEIYLK